MFKKSLQLLTIGGRLYFYDYNGIYVFFGSYNFLSIVCLILSPSYALHVQCTVHLGIPTILEISRDRYRLEIGSIGHKKFV